MGPLSSGSMWPPKPRGLPSHLLGFHTSLGSSSKRLEDLGFVFCREKPCLVLNRVFSSLYSLGWLLFTCPGNGQVKEKMGLAKGHGEFRDELKRYLLWDGAQPAHPV